ncbi:hypothetical protein HSX10_07535 [Winogradskyella undariae]|uniref:hypothetical protein n=1 Tax=Winogradskyella undariae TaxID=1285465 RepID=UPI00156B4A67|nr:hypothetical protein [Winogradskyella undariae]NRR91413.1 hypothetical protein [Winogradskyella undariae]
MIDFVRLNFKDKDRIEPFVCNKDNFEELLTVLECHSGEIRYPFTTNIGNMEIRINDKYAYVKNSIHKLNNQLNGKDAHNHNDFRYSELCKTIDHLDNRLTDLKNTRLTQLEFGLNIKLPVPAECIIRQNLILHQLKIHNHNEQFGGKGEYKQFNHYNYYFKIYDKAKQYGLEEHIIRIEIKYKSNKSFHPMGVFKLHDLKSKKCLLNLFNDLLKRFDELTIVDSVMADTKITKKDKSQLESYLSYNYWETLSERENRNRKSKEKLEFQRLLVKNDLLKTKTFLRASLIQKFNELLNS